MRNAITKKQIEELQNKQIALKLVDIRSPQEYETLHVPDLTNIPSEELNNRLNEFTLKVNLVKNKLWVCFQPPKIILHKLCDGTEDQLKYL